MHICRQSESEIDCVQLLRAGEKLTDISAKARLANVAPELLKELKKADQILHNALQIMTVEQKRRLGGMNASSGIYSEGVTRKYERTAVIIKAEGGAV